MTRNKHTAVLGAIIGLLLLALPASASHMQTDTSDSFAQPVFQDDWDPVGTDTSTSPGEDNGADVGICMIGVDSPCNSPPWNTIDDPDAVTGPEEPDEPEEPNQPDDGGDDEADVGICMIGVDSPCNSPPWDGSGNING